MLHVTCQVSHVTCQVSGVRFFFNLFLFFDKVVEPVGGGSVIMGPTPSSLDIQEL